MRWGSAVLAFLVASLAAVTASAQEPARAKIAHCAPQADEDSSGGHGNEESSRKMRVAFAYSTRSAQDDARKAAVVEATDRVEVCRGSPGNYRCPASDDNDRRWLIWSRVAKPDGPGPLPGRVLNAAATEGLLIHFDVPADYWDEDNEGEVLAIRVNRETVAQAVDEGGSCPLPDEVLRDSFNHFAMYAAEHSSSYPHVCAGGKLFATDPCLDPAARGNILNWLERAENWQRQELGATVSPPVWTNGQSDACGGYCPHQVFVVNHPASGTAIPDATYFHPDSVNGLMDVFDPFAFFLIGHEYFHQLQHRVGEGAARPLSGALMEGTARAVDHGLCFFEFPDPAVPPEQCVSPGKLGARFGLAQFLENPQNDTMAVPYESGLYWRHFIEQFAIPVGTDEDARPSGYPDSRIRIADLNLPLGHILRRSDEGMDLLYEFLVAAQQTDEPELEVADQVLRSLMGRSLRALTVDMHTAGMLKDYPDFNRRWRFEWVGDYNAGAAHAINPNDITPPADPLSVLKQSGPITTHFSGTRRPDHLPRAARILSAQVDSQTSYGNTTQYVINAYGAAYLAVTPDTAGSNAIDNIAVRLTPGTVGRPFFRVFTARGPDYAMQLHERCRWTNGRTGANAVERCDGGEDGVVRLDIPVGSGDSELQQVLVVGSAGLRPASFFYHFGVAEPVVQIHDPTTSRPVYIGRPNAVGGSRPFLLVFGLLNGAGEPIAGLQEDEIEVILGGASIPTLEPDFTLIDMTGGLYLARVTLPPEDFPAQDTDYGLRVTYIDPASGEWLDTDYRPGAVRVSDTGGALLSTQLALDLSDSMNYLDGTKLAAMKRAVSFLVDTLHDGDEVGVIGFNHDAATLLPLTEVSGATRDSIKSTVEDPDLVGAGCTSIGDALFEAQSNFAGQYDSPGAPDANFNLILLSDGINTANYAPFMYYDPNAPEREGPGDGSGSPGCGLSDPNPNDSGPWVAGTPLKYHARQDAGLKVPRISTIALGQDADLVELSNLAYGTQGIFVEAPGDGSLEQLDQSTQALQDSYRAATVLARGRSRIGTSRVYGFDELPVFAVERHATELQVNISSLAVPPSPYLRLVAPDETQYPPTLLNDRTAVFRVQNPAEGNWSWDEEIVIPKVAAQPPDYPTIFVEEVVEGRLVLLARADVEQARLSTSLEQRRRYVGSDVFIRAVPTDGGEVTGAVIWAEVTTPSGEEYVLFLADDGLHSDGSQHDGVYGARFTHTQQPGAYRVRLTALGWTPLVHDYFRERLLGFVLENGPDADGDGVPDFADPNPDVSDADGDPDADGLTNWEEFSYHTDPHRADTDESGEMDGSEIANGRNPRLQDDDEASPYLLHVAPCDGEALHTFQVPATHASVEIQAGPELEGPFTTLYAGAVPASGSLTLPASNGVRTCYRMRSTNPLGAVSSWSPMYCTKSDLDATPPTILDLKLAGGGRWTGSAQVSVEVWAVDNLVHPPVPYCDNQLHSGVADILYAANPEFTDSEWEPFHSPITVALDPDNEHPMIWVKVRDFAGNVSAAAQLPVRRSETGPEDAVLYGLEQVKLNDRVVIEAAEGASALIVSAGSLHTNIGARAATFDISSLPGVLLRSGATVDGFIETEGTVEQQDGVTVTGPVTEGTSLWLPPFPELAAAPSSGPDFELQPGEELALEPGMFGSVTVRSGGTLLLSTGDYAFSSLSIEPEANVVLDRTAGPISITVDMSFEYKSAFQQVGGNPGELLVSVQGEQGVFLYASFEGTLVAPDADVYLGTSGGLQFHGAFFARRLEVHPDATVRHVPFVFWQTCLTDSDCESNSCVNGICQPGPSCSDNAQNQDETDVDCGGSCPPCSAGSSCAVGADCQSGICTGGVCQPGAGCTESGAIDLGGDGQETVVPADGCVRVRDAYPSWWGTRSMALQSTGGGSYPVPFSWSNTCVGGGGSDQFTGDWQTKVLGPTSDQCATLIDLAGPAGGSITLRYYGN